MGTAQEYLEKYTIFEIKNRGILFEKLFIRVPTVVAIV